MSTLLAELASREILAGVTVKRLREYISNKYPQLSPALRAGIFADAVNRIVAGKLPELPGEKLSLFRAFLYSDAAKKQTFSIDCSDIFKSSLRLRTDDKHFVKGLKVWLEDVLLSPVSENKVSEYVQNVCRILDETPEMEIEMVLESIENKVGDIRPKKRVISLIHMNPVGGGANSGVDYKTDSESSSETGSRVNSETSSETGSETSSGIISRTKARASTVVNSEAQEENGIGAGEDWILIKKRKSAREVLTERISTLASYTAGLFKKAAGFIVGTAAKNAGYRKVAIAGLITFALLCTFLSALYVDAVKKAEQVEPDDMQMIEEASSVFEGIALLSAETGDEAEFASSNSGEVLKMRATAYDLSVESCGKDKEHPEYGITYSGTRAEAGRTVAVDPEVIPLGSSIRITFPEEYSHMDGIYVAEDTGRLIKGNSIDIFFGEDQDDSREINRKALRFGVQYVDVEILDDKQVLR